MRSRAILALFLLGACGESDRTVPFGLDGEEHLNDPPDDPGAAPTDRPAGRPLPDGTHRVDLEGAPIEVEVSIRSLYAHDLDDDGDRDAIVVASGPPEAPVAVLFFRRDGQHFLPSRELAHAPTAPASCVIERADVTAISDRWLDASAVLSCPESLGSNRTEHFILSVERTPRVLEQLAVLSEIAREPGPMSLRFAESDLDEDGHVDLAIDVSLGESETRTVRLAWLDRPSGLARDATQPEDALDARAREALRQLRGERDLALAQSRDVLALHRALCSESGLARLRVGDLDGVRCGTSEAAGRAATTVVRALAAGGNLLEAVEAYAHLEDPGNAINEERRTFARDAIAEAPATPGITLREGPLFAGGRSAATRLSALGFLDEDRLLLRGPHPQIFDLTTGVVTAAEAGWGDVRILDPSGAFTAVGIERTCRGYEVAIAAASSMVGETRVGPTSASALVEAVDPPSGASCPTLPRELRSDDGGWAILGWPPQGILLSRGERLRVVPLDVSGQPAGDPTELEPGTPPPAPLQPGLASRDGRVWAEIRGLGVLVHERGRAAETLFWPAGWAARAGSPEHVAVAPSGRRVAVVRDGRVLILERSP